MSGVEAGFDIAPSITTSDRPRALSYRYTTSDKDRSSKGSVGSDSEMSVMSVTSAVLFNFGYKAAW